jgi:hypothetical protein
MSPEQRPEGGKALTNGKDDQSRCPVSECRLYSGVRFVCHGDIVREARQVGRALHWGLEV